MKYPKHYGNYTGIVVQNNDPQRRGRVKVFVPHISPVIYDRWNKISKDKKFKFIGVNTYSDLTDVLDDLKLVLPWAEYAGPLVGESSSGRFNRSSNVGSTSNTNNSTTFVSDNASPDANLSKITKYTQNLNNIGESPGNKYDIDYYRVNDAFTSSKETGANNINKYAFNYKPEIYSNAAKGSFAVPAVGAHVWVFFTAGDSLRPVYFAAAYGEEDWNSIYDSGLDYPGGFENSKPTSPDQRNLDHDTYRNKYVVNQKGGTIQINNSDKRESIKMSHYSGSFKEMANGVSVELATGNDQKLVIGDTFTTVRGGANNFVQGESDSIIQGNSYIKIGNLKAELVNKWFSLAKSISDVKQLFDIQRADLLVRNDIYLTSPAQTKAGTPAPCPVCKGNETFYWDLNNKASEVSFSFQASEGGGPFMLGSVDSPGPQPFAKAGTFRGNGKIFGATCPACGGSGKSPSSMNGNWNKEPKKNGLNNLILEKAKELAEIERQMGLGGSLIMDITKHRIETVGLRMNDASSIRVDLKGKMYVAEVVVQPEGVINNRAATPLIEYVQVDDPPGGNYTLNVCNKYTIQVGAGGVSMKAYGPVNISGSITNIAGEQVNIGSSNEVNIDGGNRLSLIADIISLRQRERGQVVVDSSLGVTNNAIIGGSCHIEGELSVNHITAPTEIQQTESTVAYGRPTSLGGILGSKIGTAASLFTITTYDPVTEQDIPSGAPAYIGIPDPMMIIGTVVVDGAPLPVFGSGIPSIRGSALGIAGTVPFVNRVYGTGADDDCIELSNHSHNFKNIPLNLTKSNKDVRERGAACNKVGRQPADPIDNSKK